MKLFSVKSVPPNECPFCHVHIYPSFYAASKEYNVENKKIVVSIWNCTNQKCQKPFVAEHLILHDDVFFNSYLSGNIKEIDWPECISALPDGQNIDIPSRFLDIYKQAQIAEKNMLTELAGMGYRKAFEVLIKDWVLQSNPEDINKIKDMFITNVIKTYFSDEVKKLCDRLIWLGNDHTHYSFKFAEYGLDDIKELITIIVSELVLIEKKRHYLSIEHRK